MENEYFRLDDDVDSAGRWHLNGLFDRSGAELDTRWFRYGRTVSLGPPLLIGAYSGDQEIAVEEPLTVTLQYAGVPLDFTFAGFDMPVVRTPVAELLARLAGPDIQRVPVRVATQTETFEIINFTASVDCIDHERSLIDWWRPEDKRPDKIGKPKLVAKLVIDPSRAGGHHIFRPAGWEVVVVVSASVKAALEELRVSGVRFEPVS